MYYGYGISDEKHFEIMEKLYKYDEYKMKVHEVLNGNVGEFYSLSISGGGDYILDKKTIDEFYSCLKEDIMELDYSQIATHSFWIQNVGMEYIGKDDMDKPFEERRNHTYYMSANVNANFTRSVKWLKDNGGIYMERLAK